MSKIRKLIRETIEKAVISEAAITFNDILLNESMGLVFFENTVTLYDFKTDRVYGYMSLRPVTKSVNEFVAVASEKGYGPLTYEVGIMASFSRALLPPRDGDIRGAAFDIWAKFMNRADVHKVIFRSEDEEYSDEYDNPNYNSETDEYESDGTETIANTALIKIPNGEYKKLINRGKELGNIYKKSEKYVFDRGGEFFGYRYADS